MSDDPLFHPLPPIAAESWRRRVAVDVGADLSSLNTALDGGITVSPLYIDTARDAADKATDEASGTARSQRRREPRGTQNGGWRIAQIYDQTGPRAARAAMARDLDLDLDVAWLRLNLSGRSDGVTIKGQRDVDTLLADIDWSDRGLIIDGGPDGLAAAAMVSCCLADQSLSPQSVALAIDPLGSLALDGHLPGSLADAWRQLNVVADGAERSWWTAGVSTVPYHNGGAGPVQELAFALATGVEVLRALTRRGRTVDDAAGRIFFTFAIGRDFFVEVAKLRAVRWLWAKVLRASGITGALPPMRIVACTSVITQSRRAPLINQLRITTEAFSAALGGADDIITAPFDRLTGDDGPLGGRVAINTQHVLAEEAHVGRVADPAGGSGYVEDLTDQLARLAWEQFRGLEAKGGMASCLRAGTVADQVAARASKHRVAVAHRRDPMVGVSAFALLDEPVLEQKASGDQPMAARAASDSSVAGQHAEADMATVIDAASRLDAAALASSVASGAMARARKIDPVRWAAPFELLHDAADRVMAQRGRRPACILVRLGSAHHHQPQASFVRRALAAAGLATIEPPPAMESADEQTPEQIALWADTLHANEPEQAPATSDQASATVPPATVPAATVPPATLPPVIVCPGDLDPASGLPAVLTAIRDRRPARIVIAVPMPCAETLADDVLLDGGDVLAVLARLHVALEITP